MFEKWTKNSRSVIIKAAEICNIFGHPQLDLEHFLLALIKLHRDKKLSLLRMENLVTDNLLEAVGNLLPPFNPVKSSLLKKERKLGERSEELPFSSASSEMVKEASREAENLNSESVEPEHILLALLKLLGDSYKGLSTK